MKRSGSSAAPTVLQFSRRFDRETLEQLAEQLGLGMAADEPDAGRDTLAHEFA